MDLGYRPPELSASYFQFVTLPGIGRSTGIFALACVRRAVTDFRPDLILNYWLYPDGRCALGPPVEGARGCVRLGSDLRRATSYTSSSEGCPNVVVEALASDRAVVASDVGGIPELVNDANDVLVAPRNAPALAAALERPSPSPPLINETGIRWPVKPGTFAVDSRPRQFSSDR